MTDQKIIDLIRSTGYSKALNQLYKNFPKVLAYVLKVGGKKQDAEDIFQDSLLICIEKIRSQDFSLSSSLSTFVIGVAKNKTREHLRSSNKYIEVEGSEILEDNYELNDIIEEEKKYKALDKILLKIGKKCMDLLIMFYHKKIKMKSIAESLGFKSETSAKTQKYKCIEKARKLTASVLVQTQNF